MINIKKIATTIIAILLAVTPVSAIAESAQAESTAVTAAEPTSEVQTELTTAPAETETAEEGAEMAVIEPLQGLIVDITDDSILLDTGDTGYYVAHITSETALYGTVALEIGQYVIVSYNGISTRSLPPQITADRIECHKLTGTVTELGDGYIMVDQGEENGGLMQVHTGLVNVAVALDSPVTVYFNGVMALSLPGQISALHIDTPTVTGTVEQIMAGALLVSGESGVFQVNLDDIETGDIAEGERVKVLYNGISTRSMPAQINALAVSVDAVG